MERLQDLVTELRAGLTSAAMRNEALAKDNDAAAAEIWQLKVQAAAAITLIPREGPRERRRHGVGWVERGIYGTREGGIKGEGEEV